MSAEIAGAPMNAAVIARMKLNMKATTISIWLTPSWTSVSLLPLSRASVTSRSNPSPESPTTKIVSRNRTHRIRRRSASRSVSRTMTSSGPTVVFIVRRRHR
jgi:hypothetical protein